MHFRHDNYGFSRLVYGHGKARLAGKAQSTRFARGAGSGRSLGKRRNAVRGRKQANPKGVPVVSRSRVAALDKGTAIACALRLAAKHHRDAELAIIMSKEH